MNALKQRSCHRLPERLYQYRIAIALLPREARIHLVICPKGLARADSAVRRCSDGEDGFNWSSVGPNRSDCRSLDSFQEFLGSPPMSVLLRSYCVVLGGIGEPDRLATELKHSM